MFGNTSMSSFLPRRQVEVERMEQKQGKVTGGEEIHCGWYVCDMTSSDSRVYTPVQYEHSVIVIGQTGNART
jgi:hypothetical protein